MQNNSAYTSRRRGERRCSGCAVWQSNVFLRAKRMVPDRAKWTGERASASRGWTRTRAGRTKNDIRELCGTLRRNVKATRRPERKSFLVIHPSARGLPGEKRPVNCGSRNSRPKRLCPATDPPRMFQSRATPGVTNARPYNNPRRVPFHDEEDDDPGGDLSCVYRQNEAALLKGMENWQCCSPCNTHA